MGTLDPTADHPTWVRIDTSHRDGVLSVVVSGGLDPAAVRRIDRTIESLAGAGDVIRIDLNGVESVATAELGALLRMHQRAVNRGWDVTWVGVPRLLVDAAERFGTAGAVAAYLGASLASRAGRTGGSREVPDAP